MSTWPSETKTALLIASDGTKIYGHGFGATGHTFGEVCFNTAMSGYQEIITDPSYASQIVAFTFPHIGNVGVNPQISKPQTPTKPKPRGYYRSRTRERPFNFRAQSHLSDWLARNRLSALAGSIRAPSQPAFATMVCSMPCWLMRQTANLMKRH